jgi:hypothetical protein
MNVLVSGSLSQAERTLLDEALLSLYPKAQVNASGHPSFRVVPIADFFDSAIPDCPSVTPVALHQIQAKHIDPNLFRIPPHGLANLHLYLKEICITGFSSPRHERLQNLIACMGGIYSTNICRSTHCLIARSTLSRRADIARRHRIPVVSESWIDILFNSPDEQDCSPFVLSSKLQNVKFSLSSFSASETEALSRLIEQHGGALKLPQYVNADFLVIPERNSSASKIRKAISLSLPVTTPQYITRFLAGTDDKLRTIYAPLVTTQVFEGLCFQLDEKCLSDRDLAFCIRQNGASVSHSDSTHSIGYSPSSDRTPVWVNRCVEEGRLIDTSEFTLYVPPLTQVADNIAITITGFNGRERLDVISGIKWMGMTYSAELTHKTNVLIARTMDSNKAKTALSWGLRVVTIDWLFAVARGRPPEDVDPFLLGPLRNPPDRPLMRSFLDDDDDDDFPPEIQQQIDALCQDTPPPPPPQPQPRRQDFLSDSDFAEDPEPEVLSVEDMSKVILGYQKPPAVAKRGGGEIGKIQEWDTFTQRPLESDDEQEAVTIGYVQESRGTAHSDSPDDALLLLINGPDSA